MDFHNIYDDHSWKDDDLKRRDRTHQLREFLTSKLCVSLKYLHLHI